MESTEDDSMDQMTAAEQQQPLETKNHKNSEHLSRLKSLDVKPELVSAADVLLTAYQDRGRDPALNKFFEYLKDALTPEPECASAATGSGWNPLNWFLPTVKVHVVTTGQTFGADAALMKQVTNHAQFKVKQADKRSGSVVLLFCPITTRPGSDVKVAMSKVSGDKPVILVMMHHTRKPDYCSPATSWSDDFQNVILHVDVLFHETRGLLTCSKNDNAVQQIQKKLLEIAKNT